MVSFSVLQRVLKTPLPLYGHHDDRGAAAQAAKSDAGAVGRVHRALSYRCMSMFCVCGSHFLDGSRREWQGAVTSKNGKRDQRPEVSSQKPSSEYPCESVAPVEPGARVCSRTYGKRMRREGWKRAIFGLRDPRG